MTDAGQDVSDHADRPAGMPVSIDIDVACRGCAYNLRGLFADGACPECGAPVWLSIGEDALRYANPRWLATVAGGVKITLASLVGLCVTLAASRALFWMARRAFGAVWAGLEVGIAIGAALLATAFALWGIWRFATPEPGRFERGLTPRRKIRAGVVGAVVTPMLILLLWASALGSGPSLAHGVLLVAVIGLGSPVGLGGTLALLSYGRYTEELARRAQLPNVARSVELHGEVYRWGWPAAMALLLISLAELGLACLSVPVAICVGIVALLILIMPLRLLDRLARDLEHARTYWKR